MKKKFASFLFALAILIPCFMFFTACGEETKVTGVKAYIGDNEITVNNNTIVVPYTTANDWKNTLKVIATYSDNTTSELASTDYGVMGEPGLWEVNPEGYDVTITYMSYDPISLKIVVTGEEVVVPQVATGLVYDNGNIVTGLNVMSSDPYQVWEGFNTATDAGDYSFTLSLKPGFMWEDGTIEAKTFNWSVARKEVAKPTASYMEFNGDWQSVVSLYGNEGYSVYNGDSQGYDAGNYSVEFAVDNNHCWTGGDTENYTLNWSINKMKINVPTAPVTNFVYDGDSHGIDLAAGYTYSPDANNVTSATNAGTYTTIFSLESDNYEWNNVDPTGDKSVTWTIDRKAVAKPRLKDEYIFTYDGESHSGIICDNADSELGGIAYYWDGSDYAIDASDNGYTVEFTLVDNYRWENASNNNDIENISLTWYLNRCPVAAEPTAIPGLQYELGTSQYYGIENVDGTGYYWSGVGTTSAAGAGTYSATFTLNSNYQWITGEDKTADKVVTWTVAKAKAELPSRPLTAPEYTGSSQWVVDYEQYIKFDANYQDLPYQYNAGTYTTKFLINVDSYGDNFEWEKTENLPTGYTYIEGDNSIIVEWYIAKARIAVPFAKTGVADYLVYDGNNKEVERLADGLGEYRGFQNFNEIYSETDQIWCDAITSSNVGKYRTVFRLLNTQTTQNYIWANGTSEDVYIEWTVTPATTTWLKQPVGGEKTYDAKSFSLEGIATFDGKNHITPTFTYTVDSEQGTPIEFPSNPSEQPKDAGTYYITATIYSPEGNYTTLTKEIVYIITPAEFGSSQHDASYTVNKSRFAYTGSDITPDYTISPLFNIAISWDSTAAGGSLSTIYEKEIGTYSTTYYYLIQSDYQNNLKGNVPDDATKIQFTINWEIVDSPFESVTLDGVNEDFSDLAARTKIENLSTFVFTMKDGYVPYVNGEPLTLDSGKTNQYTYVVDIIELMESDNIDIALTVVGQEDYIDITTMSVYFVDSIKLDGNFNYDLTDEYEIWYNAIRLYEEGKKSIQITLDEKYSTKYQLAYQVDDKGDFVAYTPDANGDVTISGIERNVTIYMLQDGVPVTRIVDIYVLDYNTISNVTFTIFGLENSVREECFYVDTMNVKEYLELDLMNSFIGDMKISYKSSFEVSTFEIYNPSGEKIDDFRVAESGLYTIRLLSSATSDNLVAEIPLKIRYRFHGVEYTHYTHQVPVLDFALEGMTGATIAIDDCTNAQTGSVFKTTFADTRDGDYVTNYPVEIGFNDCAMKVTATFYGVEYNYYENITIHASENMWEKLSPYNAKLFTSFNIQLNDNVSASLVDYSNELFVNGGATSYTFADILAALNYTEEDTDKITYELVEGVDAIESITLSLHENGSLVECRIQVDATTVYSVYFRLEFVINNNTNIASVIKTPALQSEESITSNFTTNSVTLEVDRVTEVEVLLENRHASIVVTNANEEVVSIIGGVRGGYSYDAKFMIMETGTYTITIIATDGTTRVITLNVTGNITPLFAITYNGKTMSQNFNEESYPIEGDFEFNMMTFEFKGYYGESTIQAGDSVQLSAVSLVNDIYKDDGVTKIDNLSNFTLTAKTDTTGTITGIANGVYAQCIAKITMEGITMSANIILVFAEKPAPLAITVNGRTLKMEYIQVSLGGMDLTLPGGGDFTMLNDELGLFYAVAGEVTGEVTELPVTISGIYSSAVTTTDDEPIGENIVVITDTDGTNTLTGCVAGTKYSILRMYIEVMGQPAMYQILIVYADTFTPPATSPVE